MARSPKKSSLDDVIARINQNSPDKSAQRKERLKKLSAEKSAKRTFKAHYESASNTEKTILQDMALKFGIGTSAQPTAPSGVGSATKPIQTPKVGMSTAQQAVAAVNAASASMLAPTPNTGFLESFLQTKPQMPWVPPFAVPPKPLHTGFQYARAPQSAKGIPISKAESFDSIRDAAIHESEKSAVAQRRADEKIQKAIKKAIRDDSRSIVRALREEGVREAKSGGGFGGNRNNGAMPVSMQDPDDIGNLDAFNQKTNRIANARDKQESERTARWDSRKFMINRAFNLIHKLKVIGAMARAENTPSAQVGPGGVFLHAVSPFLPGPTQVVADVAAQIIAAREDGENGANAIVDAQYAMAIMNRGFGNSKLSSLLVARARNNRAAKGGSTAFERLQKMVAFSIGSLEWSPLGDPSIPENQAAADALRSHNARKKMRQESYLYGATGLTALGSYARKHKMSIQEIPENARNKIIDDSLESERTQIMMQPEFQKAVDENVPFWLYGAEKKKVRARKQEEMFDAVVANPELADKKGIKSPAFQRQSVDETINQWMMNNVDKLHKAAEAARTTDLKAKADKHRHLAEW